MKKQLLIVIIFSLLYGNKTYCQPFEKTSGKVKTIIEKCYNAVDVFGEIKKTTLIYKHVNLYNLNSKIIETNRYNENDVLTYKDIYKYDDNGNLIESNLYKPDGSLDCKVIYKYDEKGVVTGNSWYYNTGKLGSITLFKYNVNEKVIVEEYYKADGSLLYTTTHKYNDKGFIIESKGKDSSSNNIDVYDNTGNWIKRTRFSNLIPLFLWEREISYY